MKNFKLGLFSYMVKEVGMKCMADRTETAPAASADEKNSIETRVVEQVAELNMFMTQPKEQRDHRTITRSLEALRSAIGSLIVSNNAKKEVLTGKIQAALNIAKREPKDQEVINALEKFQNERKSQFEVIAVNKAVEAKQVQANTETKLASLVSSKDYIDSLYE